MPTTNETIKNILVVWDVDGGLRAPLAFFNQGAEETTVKAWRVDGRLHFLHVWCVIPSNLHWVVRDHIEPLPFAQYCVEARPSEILWWADAHIGRALDGSRHRQPLTTLKTERIMIG